LQEHLQAANMPWSLDSLWRKLLMFYVVVVDLGCPELEDAFPHGV